MWKPVAKTKRESKFVDLWLLNVLKDELGLQEEQRKSYVKFTGSRALFSRDIFQGWCSPEHSGKLSVCPWLSKWHVQKGPTRVLVL